MINNFNLIERILNFNSPDDFYFVQIIRRRKDNPDQENDMRVVDNFFIYDLEDYSNKRDRIIEVCTKYNARAYIRVNKRSLEQVGLQTIRKITELLISKDYKAIKSAYTSAAGNCHNETVKKWVIDIDAPSIVYLSRIEAAIEALYETGKPNGEIIATVSTVNGYHIICTPFNVEEFKKKIPENIDIHKDNMTILYFP